MQGDSKTTKKILTKFIVGILLTLSVVGFVFSDISQYISPQTDPIIREIGEIKIKQSDILRERDGLMQQMPAFANNPFIKQQLISRALENLTFKAAILSYGKSLGFVPSEIAIANIIKSIEAFQDVNGEFDKIKFKRTLQAQKIPLKKFTENLGNTILQNNLTQPIMVDFPLPEKIIHFFRQFAFTQIKLDAYKFSYDSLPETLKTVTPPSDAQLEQLYDEKKYFLKRPIIKDVAYIIYNEDFLKETLTIDDKDIKAYYNRHKEQQYIIPEKRHTYQIILSEQKEADTLYKTLSKTQRFLSQVKALGYKTEDIELGILTKESLDDDKIEKVIFSAREKQVTKPIQTDFGYAIYYIDNIQAQQIQPLKAVSDKIKEKLYTQRVTNYIAKNFDKINDDLAGGASLEEIAQKYGGNIQEQTKILGDGSIYLDPINKLNQLIPLDYLNDYQKGDDIPIIELEGGGFILFKIRESYPERQLTFAETRDDLYNEDLDAQKNLVINNLIKELKKAQNPAELLKEYNIKSVEYYFNRSDALPPPIYSPNLKEVIFAQKPGEYFYSIEDDRAIFLLITSIEQLPQPEQEASEEMYAQLQTSYNNFIQDRSLELIKKNMPIVTHYENLNNLTIQETGQ